MTVYNQVISKVNNSQIRKITDKNGDEIIIVPSYTMPDNVVMNGVLYPAEETEKSYHTLDGSPAPIGHPVDDEGNFVSASSEIGINRYHAGVFNKNPVKVGNRIYLEKHVNVRVASSMNRGPELLEKLNAAMTGENVEIHTSTGVYLNPVKSENAEEYDTIATGMVFDHDAILIDEIGAATPAQGVGMLVNQGKAFLVNRTFCPDDKPVVTPPKIKPEEQVPKMDKYIELLRANGVEVSDDATETEILALLNTNMSKKTEAEPTPELVELIANSVTKAVEPLQAQVSALKSNAEAAEAAERETLTKLALVSNSALSEDDVKELPLATLRKLAGNSTASRLPASEFKPNSGPKPFDAANYLKTISGLEV